MESTTQPQWYDKKWLVAVLCIFFFPVGLYALWKNKDISKWWKVGVTAMIALGVLTYFSGTGQDMAIQQGQDMMDKAAIQVALDAEEQYRIAKDNGTAIDAYTHASMVCAAWLQAKDEAKYKEWKAIEREEAARAGMPVE